MALDPSAFAANRINFSPLLQAVQGYRQGMDSNFDFRGQQELGAELASGNMQGARDAAGKYGMDTNVLLTLGEKARQEQERQRMAQALQGAESNPELGRILTPEVRASLSALPPEQRAARIAEYADPIKREQLNIQRQQAARAAADQYGKQGTVVQDKDGTYYSVQFGSNGQKIVAPLQFNGSGLSPSKGVGIVGDAMYDKATGAEVRSVAPNLQNAERVKGIGDAQGKAQGAASGDMSAADSALDLINSIRTDPNRERGTGASAVFNRVPYTKGYDFQTKVDQATSGAFLTAIQQLRGMGALSNAEGQTATKAVTRLTTATTEEGFNQALADYESVVKKGKAEAAKRAVSAQQPSAVATPQQPAPGAPQPGAVMQGYRFKGGTPSDPNSWEKVQ